MYLWFHFLKKKPVSPLPLLPSSIHLSWVSSLPSIPTSLLGSKVTARSLCEINHRLKPLTLYPRQLPCEAVFSVVIDSWLKTDWCMLRTSFHFFIYSHWHNKFIHAAHQVVIIAANVFTADTCDLSVLINSSILMLQWLAVGFTGGSDRFRQADRKTKQNRATEQVCS